MKIAFITSRAGQASLMHCPTDSATEMYWNAMKTIPGIFLYDVEEDINQFDVALVMTYKHKQISKIKEYAPNIKVGIIDPRTFKVIKNTSQCDFLIVDSIEMEDYWRKANVPICRYSEYPSFNFISKTHEKKNKIVIGYHGNKMHLNSISDTITPALTELGKKYKLELMVMYKGAPPSGNESWYPANVKVTHIQWGLDKYEKELSKCDIGLAPNKMIFKENPPYAHELNNSVNYSPDDYILRFKMPTNPGRIIVFGKLGIPTISDFYPSAFEILSSNRGITCHSKEAWKYNLERLITDNKVRQELSTNLQKYIKKNLNFELQNRHFLNFLNGLK